MKQSRLFVGGVASMAVSVLVVGALLVRKASLVGAEARGARGGACGGTARPRGACTVARWLADPDALG